jgi:exodeoxyribonuclease V gamma subunit
VALITYYSNRLEILAAELSTIVSRPLASPLAAEIIIVQNTGMARWLSMYLARQLKITANIRFPFPSAFLWDMLRSLLPGVAETSNYDRPVLTWRVLNELQDLPAD